MRTTWAAILPSAFAAARPPNPPPTMTTRGNRSAMGAHDHDAAGGQFHDQPENRKQERKRSGDPHDDPGQRLALEHREAQVRNHRPARPRHSSRPREDHGAPEQQRAPEETRVLDVVPEVGLERELVESRGVPDPEADRERRPAHSRMQYR